MKNALIAILLCGVAVAACDARRVDETEQAEAAASSVDKDWDEGAAGETGVNIKADMDKGEVELKLPGGIAGKVSIRTALSPMRNSILMAWAAILVPS